MTPHPVDDGCPLRDPATLAAFRAGEPGALARVYRHHLGGVARALRAGGPVGAGGVRVPGLANLHDVESLGHDVFLKAFAPAARAAFDGSRPFGPYVRRIARNALVDHLRAHGRVSPTDRLPELGASDETEARLDEDRIRRAVAQFCADQPEPDHSFYRLRFGEARTQEAAAAALGLTRIQGRRIEARLRAGLRAHLAAAGLLEEVSR